jgi:ketopantoate reductase
VLILGASYGSLLSTKLLLAGHDVTLICREGTANVLNENGSIVRMPIKGRNNRIELKSSPRARSPDQIIFAKKSSNDESKYNNSIYDLVVLAMQEPQYSAPDVRRLVQ